MISKFHGTIIPQYQVHSMILIETFNKKTNKGWIIRAVHVSLTTIEIGRSSPERKESKSSGNQQFYDPLISRLFACVLICNHPEKHELFCGV